MKVYKYDLWNTLFIGSVSILSGIKLLIMVETDFLSFLLLVLLGVYIWVSPMKVYVNRENLYIKTPFMFHKKLRWENISSIKTSIFLVTPNLIIEFLQKDKRRKIVIPSLIIGFRQLTEEIVKNAYNADIDSKTKAFLEGKIGYPEVFALRLTRIMCPVLMLLFLFCMFWLL